MSPAPNRARRSSARCLGPDRGGRLDIPEPVFELHQIDVFARSVLRHLQQVDDAGKSGAAGERRRDVGEVYLAKPCNLNHPGTKRVAPADPHPRTAPDPNAAGHVASDDRRKKSLRERQVKPSLTSICREVRRSMAAHSPIIATLAAAASRVAKTWDLGGARLRRSNGGRDRNGAGGGPPRESHADQPVDHQQQRQELRQEEGQRHMVWPWQQPRRAVGEPRPSRKG